MSIMAPPPKKSNKMIAPPKPKIQKQKKPKTKTSKQPNKGPTFTPKHQRDFERMEKNCYEKHASKILEDEKYRPRVVKVSGWGDKVYYICKECLDEYMKKHEELKKIIISFGR